MENLIVGLLRSANVSTVIVIDAVDECKDKKPGSAILFVLGQPVPAIPSIKPFITSRPETYIMVGFHGQLLKDSTDIFILHNVEPRTIDGDMCLFFKHELSELACRHGWDS